MFTFENLGTTFALEGSQDEKKALNWLGFSFKLISEKRFSEHCLHSRFPSCVFHIFWFITERNWEKKMQNRRQLRIGNKLLWSQTIHVTEVSVL